MDILTATKARSAEGEIIDRAAWKASGGEPFLVALQGAVDTIYDRRIADAEAVLELSDQHTGDISAEFWASSSVEPAANTARMWQPRPDQVPLFAVWQACYDNYTKLLGHANPGDKDAIGTRTVDLLRSFGTATATRSFLNPDSRSEIVLRLTEAANYLEAMSSETDPDRFPRLAQAVIAQLDWEFQRLMEAN